MGRRADAILVHRLGVCLVLPDHGEPYYVRTIGDKLETIAAEEVGTTTSGRQRSR